MLLKHPESLDEKGTHLSWDLGVMEWWSNEEKRIANTPVLQYSSGFKEYCNDSLSTWGSLHRSKIILDITE
jgi:hypothetical protein